MSTTMAEKREAAIERRLRTVYDALDLGQTKRAVQEADKVLKKHADMPSAKALKTIALLRCERLAEAKALLDELEHLDPVAFDSHTTSALQHAYKELGVPERIVRLFERICATRADEESLASLCMAQARVLDYKGQQQTAMRLYKEHPSTPYYFWHISALFMQASVSPDLGRRMFLPLAERMIRKWNDEGRLSQPNEVWLWCAIRASLGQAAEAADFLESEQCCLRQWRLDEKRPTVTDGDIATRCHALRLTAGQHDRAREVAKRQIALRNSDLTWWRRYFDAIKSELLHDAQAPAIDLLSEAKELISQQNFANPSAMVTLRLDLCKALLRTSFNRRYMDAGLNPLADTIAFATDACSRPGCFSMLSMYVDLLTDDEVPSLVEHCSKLLELYPSTSERLVPGLLVQLLEFARRHLQTPFPMAQHARFVDLLCKDATEIDEKDREQILSMVAQAVGESALSQSKGGSQNREHLFDALVAVEIPRRHLPKLQGLLLVQLHLLARLGYYDLAVQRSRDLNIKAVQRDTLGHITWALAEQNGLYSVAISNYNQLSVFFDKTESELADAVVQAHRIGFFEDIPQIVDFLDANRCSVIALCSDISCRLLASLFQLVDTNSIVDTLEGDNNMIDWNSARDNRDMESLIPMLFGFEHINESLALLRARSFKELLDLGRMRELLCRCMAAIGRQTASSDELNDRIRQLEDWWNGRRSEYHDPAQNAEHLVTPPTLGVREWLNDESDVSFLAPILNLFKMCSHVVSQTGGNLDQATLTRIQEDVDRQLEALLRSTQLNVDATQSLASESVLRRCSHTLIVLSILRLTLRLLEWRLTGSITSTTKSLKNAPNSHGAKKKRDPVSGELEKFSNSVRCAAATLAERLVAAREYVTSDGFAPKASGYLAEQNGGLAATCPERSLLVDQCRQGAMGAIESMLTTIHTAWPRG